MKPVFALFAFALVLISCPEPNDFSAPTPRVEFAVRVDSIGQVAARIDFCAERLSDSTILFIGGRKFVDSVWIPTSEVTLYNVVTGQEQPLPAMERSRAYCESALTPSGKILVSGGIDSLNQVLNTIECFDPVEGTWSTLLQMISPRWQFASTVVADSLWFLVGGRHDYDNSTSSVAVVNLNSKSIAEAPSLPEAVHNTATYSIGSTVYVMGGRAGGSNSPRTNKLLKLSSNLPVWLPVATYQDSVSLPTLGAVRESLIAIGGCTEEEPSVTCVDDIHVLDGQAFTRTDANFRGSVYPAVAVEDSIMVVAGGLNQLGVVADAHVLMSDAKGSIMLKSLETLRRARGKAVSCKHNGKLCFYLLGGCDNSQHPVTTVERLSIH